MVYHNIIVEECKIDVFQNSTEGHTLVVVLRADEELKVNIRILFIWNYNDKVYFVI